MSKQNLLSKLLLLVAVMLAGAGTAWAEEVTYTVESKTEVSISGLAPEGSSATYSSTYGTKCQLTKDNSMTLTLSGYDGKKITGLSLSMKSNTSKGGGTLSVSAGTTTIASISDAKFNDSSWYGSWSTNYVDVDITLSNESYIIQEGENVVITIAATENSLYCQSFTLTYADAPTLIASDFALTNAPVALTFDLYDNKTAQTISYTTSSTGTVSVDGQGYVSAYVDESAKTIEVTPMMKTSGEVTITVSQAADDTYKAGSVSFTVTIDDSTPILTHTATFSVNGTTTTQEVEEGAAITFPNDPADISGKSFVGWTTTAIDGTTNTAPTFVNTATMGSDNVTFYAVFAEVTPGTSAIVTDELTQSWTGVTGTTYSDWSGKTATSSAVYAGNSAGGNSSIQLRSNNNNSGIVTTTSGGKAKKVVVEWYNGTADERSIDIYGKNTPYSKVTDVYDISKYGTKIGSIEKKTGTELTINDDYEYLAIRSYSGALYLTKISIDWETGTPDTYSDYCTTVVAAAVEKPVITVAENPFFFSTTATITCATEGAAIKYSFDGTTWSDYSAALTINETKTIYAKAIKGSDESSVAQVTATKNLAEPIVTIDATGITNTNVFEGTAAGSLAATVTYNDAAIEGATVTWSGNNDDVATIDATTGAVTLVGAGSVTFTATFAANADYSEKTATYEMTVTNIDPNANDGSKDKPYTVAEAIAFIETLGSATSTDDVYVSGIISQVDEYNSKYSSITYWISDDGKTTTQMEVYSGKGFDGANFSSKDDLQVGDIVTVKGKVKMYNSTPEFVQNNQLVSFNRPVVASITVSPTTVEATAAETDGTLTVTYNNLTNYLSEVQFVASDGETSATYDWLDAEINTTDDTMLDYTIGENTTTEVRKAYMKVYAVGDEGEAYSNLITITQAAPVIMNTYTLATSITSGKHYVIASGTDGTVSVMGAQKSNNRAAVDGEVSGTTLSVASDAGATEVIIYGPDASGLYSIYDKDNGYLYAASSSSNYLKSQAINTMNGKWVIVFDENVASIKASGSNTHNMMQYNGTNNYNLFSCYSNAQGDVYLFEKDGDVAQTSTVDVKLNANGFATYASTGVLDFLDAADASFSAWQITGVSTENKITFEQIESTVATGTGIMLKGEANATITLNVMPGTGAKLSDNKLVGITEPTTIAAGEYYGLSGNNFVKVGAGEAPANKALLPASLVNESNSTRFTFVFEGETTGIATVKSVQLNETIYNLRGQRVDNPVKGGLYIVGGKKVIMK